jgi:CRP/FNR family transcriptional regulator, cyclic AMP receptor protein
VALEVSLGEVMGWIGALFTVAIHSMRTMIPLRSLAIAANCVFIAYGAAAHVWPMLFLHSVLLPLNSYRLWQMVSLTLRVREASRGDPSMSWLKPFSSRRHARAGEVIFTRGNVADAMFYVTSGYLRLVESGLGLGPGEVVGELGLAAPDARRTQTLRCEEDAELLVIEYEQVRRLYFQNPTFGFYLLGLMTQRLFDNNAELARRLAELQPDPGSKTTATAVPAQGNAGTSRADANQQ